MNYVSLLFFGLPLVVGLAFGWQIRTQKSPTSPQQEAPAQTLARSSPSTPSGNPTSPTPRPSATSSDTVEDLLALPTTELYNRLALWIFDASPAEISTFYQGYRDSEIRNRSITDLLFIGWTRVDPESAISTTRGTKDHHFADWAWACHEPAKALNAAIERGESINNVAWGIGEFHPGWLAENMETIPESDRSNALSGLAKWPDTETPELSIALLLEHSYSIPELSLLALARQDPAKAYQLLKEHIPSDSRRSSRDHIPQLLQTLATHDPQLLTEITPLIKAPQEKKKIQSLLFNSLLKQDPEAAQAMLEETPRSWLKDELAMTYANHLMNTDHERAFDYALDLFGGELSAFTHRRAIKYGTGTSSSSNGPIPGATDLISSLLDQDPNRLMNTLSPGETSTSAQYESTQNQAFSTAMKLWSQQNLTGFADWVISRQDTPEYHTGAVRMTDILTEQHEFEPAMEWAESIPTQDGSDNYQARGVYRDWVQRDPEAAAAWRLSEDFSHNPERFPLPEGFQEP